MQKSLWNLFVYVVLISGVLLNGCSSGGANSGNGSQNIAYYQNWMKHLSGYNVAQGSAYLMQNVDCPTFVAVFNSCFGQNPASPYIIPQPPVGNAYVDPDYAVQFESSSPTGATTDIFYRLSDNDALVTIISYPPEAAYLGYQSYVFTSESSNYTSITPPRNRVVSPDPSRYDIFGSLGNDINNLIIQNKYGSAPWGGNVIMYITTSNQNLANALTMNAQTHGINANSIFVEPVGSNVITGNESSSDDMLTLMRYAVPESTTAATNWSNMLESNVLVYKVSNTNIPVSRFGVNQYTAHTVNNVETSLDTALQQLATLLQTYLAQAQTPTAAATSYQTIATTEDNASGVPTTGLVGAYCILYGTNCEGDNQDTSTYATLTESSVVLGPNETVFIAGVNHSMADINNNRYVSVDIYNAANSSGVASSSQTNVDAVGFNSGVLTGSAEQILTSLGITIPTEDTALNANIADLYVTFVTRDCNNPTIAAAKNYCLNLMGTSLIPLNDPISITERSYVVPGSTTGGYVPSMVYPYIIAAKHDFITN